MELQKYTKLIIILILLPIIVSSVFLTTKRLIRNKPREKHFYITYKKMQKLLLFLI